MKSAVLIRGCLLIISACAIGLLPPSAHAAQGTLNSTGAPANSARAPRDYSVIDMQDATIPKQPAAGPVLGKTFTVRRAKIEGADLILKGDATSDVPEIRLHAVPAHKQLFSTIPQLVERAARFRMATLLLGNGSMGKAYTVIVRTADRTADLTSDAGIRLAFEYPQNGACKTFLDLGFGRSRKDYVVGEFATELPPDLWSKVQNTPKGPGLGPPWHRR